MLKILRIHLNGFDGTASTLSLSCTRYVFGWLQAPQLRRLPQWALYSLYSPPHGRTLQQEKPRNLKCEKSETDCNIEHKALDRNALLVSAHPGLAVEEVQKGIIVAGIGHDAVRYLLWTLIRTTRSSRLE